VKSCTIWPRIPASCATWRASPAPQRIERAWRANWTPGSAGRAIRSPDSPRRIDQEEYCQRIDEWSINLAAILWVVFVTVILSIPDDMRACIGKPVKQ
jgi:hypothetical protein